MNWASIITRGEAGEGFTTTALYVSPQEAIEQKDQDRIEEEFGDLIFSLVNFARFLNIDAENALEITNKKFRNRFIQMEEKAMASGKDLSGMTLQEMDTIWDQIKRHKA